MKFWDSSALLPLLVEEGRSTACRQVLRQDRSIAVWALTPVELTSALHRQGREGALTAEGLEEALARLDAAAAKWTEVEALVTVRERAVRLLAVHPLTSADALQLAAALVLAGERPKGRGFVCTDDRLTAAARAEGFSVIAALSTR